MATVLNASADLDLAPVPGMDVVLGGLHRLTAEQTDLELFRLGALLLLRALALPAAAVALREEGETYSVLIYRDGAPEPDGPFLIDNVERAQLAIGPIASALRDDLPASGHLPRRERSGVLLPFASTLAASMGDGVLLGLSDKRRNFDQRDHLAIGLLGHVLAVMRRLRALREEGDTLATRLREADARAREGERSRAMADVAGGAVHDLNNTLTAIIARTQLLQADIGDTGARHSLRVIERAAEDGAETVRRVLEYSRGHMPARRQLVSMNAVIEDVLEVSRPRWESIDPPVHIVRGLRARRPVAGSPAELRETLLNLVLNALDAIGPGGTIWLTTFDDGKDIVTGVRDNGPGVSTHVREHVFEPFVTTKANGGTGLGLSVVKSIVTAHNGQVTLEPGLTGGASFVIRLPAVTDVEAPLRARALVVDQQPLVAEVISHILSSQGYTVDVFTAGQDALRALRGAAYDVVFLDVQMPSASGGELITLARQIAPCAPLILMSDHGHHPSTRELASLDQRWLYKPFQLSDILHALDLLRRGRH